MGREKGEKKKEKSGIAFFLALHMNKAVENFDLLFTATFD